MESLDSCLVTALDLDLLTLLSLELSSLGKAILLVTTLLNKANISSARVFYDR